jgi:hypothetical protein
MDFAIREMHSNWFIADFVGKRNKSAGHDAKFNAVKLGIKNVKLDLIFSCIWEYSWLDAMPNVLFLHF